MDYNFYMSAAYEQALIAYEKKETPIGCVIVYNDAIVARGRNMRNEKKNALYHAELIAINEASFYFGDWRLEGAVIFVTVEPCPMCAGAVINARIGRVIYGAPDPKSGAVASVCRLFDLPFNHRPGVVSGILRDECAAVLSEFFKVLRKK